MEADERLIRETHAIWIDAVNTGDLACLFTLMTHDVVLLNPGGARLDRNTFSAKFSGAHQDLRIRCSSELEEIAIAGDIAYTLCRDKVSATPHAGGETTELSGHRITIYRKQADGRWLLARDAHTLVAC